jgi:hypothetical protein
MNFDAMGNYYGSATDYLNRDDTETEANVKPVTQTITTDPKTGDRMMTVKGRPEDLSAANPNTPTVVPARNDNYSRMIQAESGGRQFAPNGQILTSPKGALGMAQIMPATAANPGYGVRPATPEEIATPEGNRAFGERYYQGLLQHFGGDQQKATAAYNAGPGRVQQNVQNNQGQLNVAQLPQETQTYLNRVAPTGAPIAPVAPTQMATAPQPNFLQRTVEPVLNAIIPSAAAATVPTGTTPTITPPAAAPAPVAPTAIPPVAATTPATTPPAAAPAPVPEAPTPLQVAQQRYQQIQQNPIELLKYAQEDGVPDFLKIRASQQARDLLNYEEKKRKSETEAKEMLINGDPRIGREIAKKGDEGSWLKMILLGYISPQLAGEEAIKLGFGKRWQDETLAQADGTEVGIQIQRRGDGKILQGTYADGTPLSPADLAAAQAGTLAKGVHVNKTETRMDPATKQLINVQTLSNGKERYMIGGKIYTGDKTNLVDASDYTKQEDRRVNAAYLNLSRLTALPTDQQKHQALVTAGVPLSRIEQELGKPAGSLTAPAPQQAAPAPQQAAPAPQQAAPASAVNPFQRPVQNPGEFDKDYKIRLEQWENKTKLQQKDAEAFANKATETRTQLNDIKSAIGIVQNGQYFMGPLLGTEGSKVLPGVQEFFASKFGDQTTTDNTRKLRSLLTREGLEGIKNSMGPSISNFDVQAWLKSNPVNENSSPQALEGYFSKLYNTLYDMSERRRKTAVDLGMLEPSFSLGEPLPSKGAQDQSTGTTSSGNKYKRVQ